MPIWKEQSPPKKDTAPIASDPGPRKMPEVREPAANIDLPRRAVEREAKESLIATDLTIEGKIQGAGHVRIAGNFKGDIDVEGNLTIEAGAKVTGSVRAKTVVVGGQLDGNIDAATSVELLKTGVLNGDLTAGSLTVAAGSRMRGQVEFGWEDEGASKAGRSVGSSSAA
jgi:cytoskeletal protein CcmA (bactofilin family)